MKTVFNRGRGEKQQMTGRGLVFMTIIYFIRWKMND